MSRLIFAQVIARSGEFVDRLGPAFQVKIFRIGKGSSRRDARCA